MPSANVKGTQSPEKEYVTCDVPGNYPRQCHLLQTESEITPLGPVEMTTTINYSFTCRQYRDQAEASSIYLRSRDTNAQIGLVYGQVNGVIELNSKDAIILTDADPATTLAAWFLYTGQPMCSLKISYTQRPRINTVNLLGEQSKL